MKNFFLLFCLIFCSFQRQPQHIVEANRLSKSFIHTICATNNCKIIGDGGCFMHGIKEFCLTFVSKNTANIEEARESLIRFSNQFLDQINNDSKARPFLIPSPMQIEGINILLGYPLKNSYLSLAMIKNGKLFYAIENEQHRTETVHTETYEEAVNILQSQGKL